MKQRPNNQKQYKIRKHIKFIFYHLAEFVIQFKKDSDKFLSYLDIF